MRFVVRRIVEDAIKFESVSAAMLNTYPGAKVHQLAATSRYETQFCGESTINGELPVATQVEIVDATFVLEVPDA